MNGAVLGNKMKPTGNRARSPQAPSSKQPGTSKENSKMGEGPETALQLPEKHNFSESVQTVE